MNYNRAQEILNSNEKIEVLYNGKPVWIEELQPNGVTAYVYYESSSEQDAFPVPINNLIEAKNQIY